MDIGRQLRVIVAEPFSEPAPGPATEEEAGTATEESRIAAPPGAPAADGGPEEAGGSLPR